MTKVGQGMMTAALIISSGVLAISILASIWAKRRSKAKPLLPPLGLALIGIFFALFTLFIPIHQVSSSGAFLPWLKQVLSSIYSSLAVFLIAYPFDAIVDISKTATEPIGTLYTLLGAILYIMAPVITLTAVLSIFSDLGSYIKYLWHWSEDVYVFTELNEKSATLADSLKDKGLIVFHSECDSTSESNRWAEEAVSEMGAVVFSKSILSVNLGAHRSNAKMTFFAIGDDESEVLQQGLGIIEKYKGRQKTELYIFSDKVEAELVLSNVDKGAIVVRRISEAQSLVYRTIYEKSIFKEASQRPALPNGNRLISAVIVGLGKYGTEVLKALTWCGQMDGYEIEINVFEQDPQAESKFRVACTELMDEEHNDKLIEGGEAYYRIVFHTGVETGTEEFAEQIRKLSRATLVYVSLGSDSANIETAVYLRMLFERMGSKPEIQAIVYDSGKAGKLRGAKNFRKMDYGIDFVGDLKSVYREDVIMGSDLEKMALKVHMKWGTEEDFFAYEYNYRSSMASAIHAKYRKECGIAGTEKERIEDLSNEEILIISRIEHRRWNAYMRTNGYTYSGSLQKSSRNDLAKVHHNLVPFDMLNDADKKKDIDVGFM